MIKRTGLAAAILLSAVLGSAGAAQAAWVYQANEDAFSDDVTHIALGMTAPYGAGFRCTDADDLMMIYMTPEEADADTIETISIMQPKLLVRVDSDEVVTLPVSLELAADDTIIAAAEGDEIAAVAKAASAAKQRVAIALEVMGQRMHVKDMDVRGSTNAIDQLVEGCGIE